MRASWFETGLTALLTMRDNVHIFGHSLTAAAFGARWRAAQPAHSAASEALRSVANTMSVASTFGGRIRT